MHKRKFFFGKHKGEFIIDVINSDVQYITWMIEHVDWLKLNNYEFISYQNKLKTINRDLKMVNVSHRNVLEEEFYKGLK